MQNSTQDYLSAFRGSFYGLRDTLHFFIAFRQLQNAHDRDDAVYNSDNRRY